MEKLTDYKTNWEDCSISFVCPNCGEDMIVDSQNGPEECECGKTYYLYTSILVGE